MSNKSNIFRKKLVHFTGLSGSAIDAAWPEWWSEAADSSSSAQAELRFTLARKLGLDPRSLLGNEEPRFIWGEKAKYKNYKGDIASERAAITSFGVALGKMLVRGCEFEFDLSYIHPLELRRSILSTSNSGLVDLISLVSLLWSAGIPLIHPRVYPLAAKHMCAMAVNTGDRYAVLLAKDSKYPAISTFHIAHEIGHIVLGHLSDTNAVVDMDDLTQVRSDEDEEEVEADCFALALLTGNKNFSVENIGAGSNSKELASEALRLGREYQIEPGTLALCYGYSCSDWAVANGALKYIYQNSSDVWKSINQAAVSQISWELLDDETASYLHAVIGAL